jgi:hypothetical protein
VPLPSGGRGEDICLWSTADSGGMSVGVGGGGVEYTEGEHSHRVCI